MSVGPDQCPASDRATRRGDFFQGLADDRLVKYEVVRHIKHQHRRFDIRRIDGGKLVGLAEVKEMIGIGQSDARGRGLIEKALDFEFVANRLPRIFVRFGRRRSESPSCWPAK